MTLQAKGLAASTILRRLATLPFQGTEYHIPMRPRLGLLFAGSLLLIATPSNAGVREFYKIGLHLVPRSGGAGSSCERAPRPPCNEGEPALTVHGELNRWYTLYFLILDGDPVLDGVQGAAFGISYDKGIEAGSWVSCERGVEVTKGFTGNTTWPDSGSGMVVLWDKCRNVVASGDRDEGITAVIGSLDVYAHSPGAIRLTAKDSDSNMFCVYDCSGRPIQLMTEFAGAVTFGDLPGAYDPCRGPFSEYPEIGALDQRELRNAQVKLSAHLPFGGGYTIILTPGYFTMQGWDRRFQRPGCSYSGDSRPKYVRITTEQMKAILERIGAMPEITKGGMDETGNILSFSLKWTSPDGVTHVFDRFPDSRNGSALFGAVAKCLEPGAAARQSVERMACGLFMLPPDLLVAEVTYYVDVSFAPGQQVDDTSGPSLRMTVRNSGPEVLPSPISVVFDGVVANDLLDPTGETCGLDPLRALPYVNLPVERNLAPGDTVSMALHFRSASEEWPPRFGDLSFRVYAGNGVR